MMRQDYTPDGIPARLYGRRRGHPLRPRQQRLLDLTLPRLRLSDAEAAAPPSPLWLEIGFGGGEHTLSLRAAHPDVTLIGSEVFENGLCSLLSRLVPEGAEADAPLPARLRLWPEDSRRLLTLLPAASVDRLYLMFPDPWPKARHAKRRFVHPAMLAVVARVLKPGAEWRIASDDPTYQGWVAECFARQDVFALLSVSDSRPEGWFPTRYEAKAIAAGRVPRYWAWRRA